MNNVFKHKQLLLLIAANFKEIIREPAILFWGIVFPILMALGLGFAFNQKADVTRKIAIIEKNGNTNILKDSSSTLGKFLSENAVKPYDTAIDSANYILTIKSDKLGNTILKFYQTSWENALILLKRGNINMLLEEKNGNVVYNFDPRNPDAQLSYLQLSRVLKLPYLKKESTDAIIPLTVSGTRYIDFLVPGLIAMGIMMSCMWGLSYGIIEKRSKKLLRRMVATPMKKSHFLISLVVVRLIMNAVEAAVMIVFAYFVFGIIIQGSIAALLAVFIAANISFSGIAILISSHTSKTEIGNGLINVVIMPMMLLSGIYFSYHNFPDWAILIIQKFPLTIVADSLRSIFIEGVGYATVFVSTLIMATTGIVAFLIGLKLFKWH